jgi:carboxypeptidase C (cathepsin A)
MADEPKPAAPPPKYTPPTGATKEFTWRGPDGVEHRYQATAEWITLRKRENPAAEVFHTHYRLLGAGKRPITFVFNGGPGAASAYLHLGGLGPKRVAFDAKGNVPPPPVALVDNTESWLAFSDLVFIDPVGTGLSRIVEDDKPGDPKEKKDPTKHVDEKEYYALNRDLESLGEFAQRFLSKHQLWDVPVHLAGESYGGFRTGKLARLLQEKSGIGLSSVMAISPALEWDALNQTDYDVLRYTDTFAPMALAAAFHGRSRVFTAGEPVEQMRPQIEAFVARHLGPTLVYRDAAGQRETDETFARAADFLGLDRGLVARAQGRVSIEIFVRELLRDQQKVLGMYDATITGVDPYPDRPMQMGPDPTLWGTTRLFASGINHLLRGELGVSSDRLYELLSMEVNMGWKRDDNKHAFDLTVGATDDLRFAMSLNPHMKVMITHGWYDLVTPYFTSQRLVEQMRLLPEQKTRLYVKNFGGGHMYYSWESSRREFTEWVRKVAY